MTKTFTLLLWLPLCAMANSEEVRDEANAILADVRDDIASLEEFEKKVPPRPTDCALATKWQNIYIQKRNECRKEIDNFEKAIKKAQLNFDQCKNEHNKNCVFSINQNPCEFLSGKIKQEKLKLNEQA